MRPDAPDPNHAPTEAPTPLDVAMMRRALALADHAATLGEVPVGAVVYPNPPTPSSPDTANPHDVQPIAEGINRRETHHDPTGHAEIVALRAAAESLGTWRLTGYTLAVTLEPCPMCAGALVNARIDRLVYAAADPKAGYVRSLHNLCDDPRLNHRLTIIPGVLADPAAAQLRAFFKARR
ncbi:MAG: nucleoside deaminase [Planctomycetota bacterium]